MFIDEETKLKIVLAAEGAPRQLVEMFHPMQLERRFGGQAETPSNCWPPHMVRECCPPEEVAQLHGEGVIRPDAYDRILEENPELYVHPIKLSTEGRLSRNMHFVSEHLQTNSSQYNLT